MQNPPMLNNQPMGLPPDKDFWDAGSMLDLYILDYLKKRDLIQTASAFKVEAKLADRAPAFDAPNGFLLEWWLVFWEVFLARTNPGYSEAATNYLEAHKKGGLQPPGYSLQQQQQQQQLNALQQARSMDFLDPRDWRVQQHLQREQLLRQQQQLGMAAGLVENAKLESLLKQQQNILPGGPSLSAALAMERAGSLGGLGQQNSRQALQAAMVNHMQGGGLGQPHLPPQNMPRGAGVRPDLQHMARLQAAAAGQANSSLGRLGSMPNSDSMDGGYMEVGPSPHSLLPQHGGGLPMNGGMSAQHQLLQQLQRQQQANQLGLSYSPSADGVQNLPAEMMEARKMQMQMLVNKAALANAQRAGMGSPGPDPALLAAMQRVPGGLGSLGNGPLSTEQHKQLLTHQLISKRIREQQQQQQQGLPPHMIAGALSQQGGGGQVSQQLAAQQQQQQAQGNGPQPPSQLSMTRQSSWNMSGGKGSQLVPTGSGSLPGPSPSGQQQGSGATENGGKAGKGSVVKPTAASSRPKRGKASVSTPSANGNGQASSPHNPTPSNGSGNDQDQQQQQQQQQPALNGWHMDGGPSNSGNDGGLGGLYNLGSMNDSGMMRARDSMAGAAVDFDGLIPDGFEHDMDFLGADDANGALADSMLGGVGAVESIMGLKRSSDSKMSDDSDSKRRKTS